jgi:hypothetical protein
MLTKQSPGIHFISPLVTLDTYQEVVLTIDSAKLVYLKLLRALNLELFVDCIGLEINSFPPNSNFISGIPKAFAIAKAADFTVTCSVDPILSKVLGS